jgi:hypothetical protein
MATAVAQAVRQRNLSLGVALHNNPASSKPVSTPTLGNDNLDVTDEANTMLLKSILSIFDDSVAEGNPQNFFIPALLIMPHSYCCLLLCFTR